MIEPKPTTFRCLSEAIAFARKAPRKEIMFTEEDGSIWTLKEHPLSALHRRGVKNKCEHDFDSDTLVPTCLKCGDSFLEEDEL